MSPRWIALLVLGATVAWSTVAPEAEARSRGRRGPSPAQIKAAKERLAKQIQQQVDYAKQVLAQANGAASSARGQIDDANTKLEGARSSLDSARTNKRSAAEELKQVEEDLITVAGEDAPISIALGKQEDAEDDVQDGEHRVLTSPEYQAQVAELQGLPDRAVKMAELRKQALATDAKYQTALRNLATARQEFSKLRSEVIFKDPKWIAASEALREQHREESSANTEATKAGLQKLPASRNLRDANNVAANAQAAIAQGEAAINSLGVNKTKAPTSQAAKKKK